MGTKFVTAVVNEKESSLAGKALGLKGLEKLQGDKPDLVIVFGSPDYNYEQVFESIRSVTGNIQIIGCTSAGEFTEEEISHGGIACGFISSDTYCFFSGIGEGIQNKQNEAIQTALQNIPKNVSGFSFYSALLFIDGMSSKGEEAVKIASTLLGDKVKVFGGAAADNYRFKKTNVFGGGAALSDSASICYVASQSPIVCSVKHGHYPISPPLKVTKAKDNILYELEGKPALQVWKEYIQEEISDSDLKNPTIRDSETLTRLLLKYEAGVIAKDAYKIRSPLSSNPDGSINFLCTIEKNSLIKIMGTNPKDQINSAREAAKQAYELTKGQKLAGLIVFDCACRRKILKEEFPQAISAIKDVFPQIPLIGLETYGEIAHESHSSAEFHNTTTVIVALPE